MPAYRQTGILVEVIMKIKEKIQADLKEAMKANDTIKRDTLRILSSMIRNAEIGKRKEGGKIDDDGIMKIISQSVKQRRESAKQYKKGGRDDLAEKEEQELKVILNYLPRQLSAEEIKKIVDEVIVQTKSQSESDIGKVMGAVMREAAGKADGNLVKKIVEKSLKTVK